MMAKQCYSIAIKPCKGTSRSELILVDKKTHVIEGKGKIIILEHMSIEELVLICLFREIGLNIFMIRMGLNGNYWI